MKLNLTAEMSFETMTKVLNTELPQYEIKLLKNPIARFEYIQVKKSGTVGLWIRIFEKKDEVMLIKAIPSALARAFLGFILLLFVNGALNEVRDEVGELLKKEFNTTTK